MACLVAVLLAGCVAPVRTAPLVVPMDAPDLPRHYDGSKLVFIGVAVTDFDWRYANLASWRRSSELLRLALHRWFGVPMDRCLMVANPDVQQLRDTLVDGVEGLASPDDLVVIYLGTHHLKNGDLLLGNRERIRAPDLAGWLAQTPQRKLLLADVCFAAGMEREAAFPDNVVRLHAASAAEKARELDFATCGRAARRGFTPVRDRCATDLGAAPDSVSLFGFLLLQALEHEQRHGQADLTIDRLFQTVTRGARRVHREARAFPCPMPVSGNLQPWPLARHIP
jgi:hypothetical protein